MLTKKMAKSVQTSASVTNHCAKTTTAVDAHPCSKTKMVSAFKIVDLVVKLIQDIPNENQCSRGAFYVFPDVSSFSANFIGTEIKRRRLAMYLLSQANVATVTGEAFENPNCILFLMQQARFLPKH
jgi:aspartate aminotransferase